jgi:uncharacterized membrane protein affecting hemolysin expression
MPSTGGNVGAYHIGFYSLTTGSGSSGLFNQTAQQSLTVYPNPTTDKISINQLFTKPVVATIYSMEGKLILQETLAENANNELDLSSLKAGVYYIQVVENNKAFTQKLVKN